MRVSNFAAVLGLVGCVVACGACSSNTTADGGADGAPISCTAASPPSGTTMLTGLDDACLGGPTIREILALVHPSYTSTLKVGSATTVLTIGIGYGGGAATCASEQDCPPGHGSCTPNGLATVDVPVTMTFKTADGAFDDTVPVTLTLGCSRSMPVARVDAAGTLPVAMHKGTYVPTAGTTELDFTGSFGATTGGVVGDKSPKFSAGGGTWM